MQSNHMHITPVKSGVKANRIVGTIESFVELRSLKRCKRTERNSNILLRAHNQLIKIFSWELTFLHHSDEPQLKQLLNKSITFNRSAKLRCFSQDEQRNAVKRNVMGTDDRLRSQTFALSFIFKINSKSSAAAVQFSSSSVQQQFRRFLVATKKLSHKNKEWFKLRFVWICKNVNAQLNISIN